ncbi:Retrovirus-related Pol polyprotein from transposon TNT 1-94 [Gossypium australe]|uniref:Retrovirus-related Pol polyprotein from transposon TNT 1-94 n=1 Tax=Gossypium australe TaxID=47621 RepID=A0A5B6VA18_9ROSI|nr:Retrovirus-related Pol polyprotein from transposon TNT 1-94 [Gossypium australe]
MPVTLIQRWRCVRGVTGFLVTDNHDVMLVDQDELTTYQEAMSDLDSKKWLETMKSEMQSMYKDHWVQMGFQEEN